MRYHDTVARSAELLRLVIPFMSNQDAALHPISYAVWYEYAAGSNAALRSDIDALMQGGRKLTEEATFALYKRHVVNANEETTERVNRELAHLLREVSASTEQTGGAADRYALNLTRLSHSLDPAPPPAALQQNVNAILRDTSEIKDSIASMKYVLDESRAEVERLRLELDHARQEALMDALTGLANRKGFDLALTTAMSSARANTESLALIMIDIDHFKLINDTHGHLFGDRVIRTIAQALKATVKGKDVVARYGGEEFAILLSATPISGAHAVAEQIRRVIEGSRIRRADSDQALGNLTVSSGVATLLPNESASAFIERADAALYRSKSDGRNCVTVAPVATAQP